MSSGSRRPTVSVVVSSFGAPERFSKLLAALRLQTYTRFEVLVVTDGSEPRVPSAPGARALAPSASWAQGSAGAVASAAGEILAILDPDVVPFAGWLDDLVTPFQDPSVAGARGVVWDRTGFNKEARETSTWTNVAWRTAILRELANAASDGLEASFGLAMDHGLRVIDLGGASVLRISDHPSHEPEPPRQIAAVATTATQAEKFVSFGGWRDMPPLRLCLVSREYPPDTHGGIGRFTRDLAESIANEQHEVHVITSTTGAQSNVRLEEGVWMHRLADNPRFGLGNGRASEMISRSIGVWHEVQRTLAWGPLDLISAPLWDGEGLVCCLDPRLRVVTSLMTSHKTVMALSPAVEQRRYRREVLAVEAATVSRSRAVHALSEAIATRVEHEYPLQATKIVVPPAVPDRSRGHHSPAENDRVEVLFVGRLEFRKGVDVLLAAVEALLPTVPNIRLTLGGRDTTTTATGESYRAAFARRARGLPRLEGAVRFFGSVDDAELDELYRRCDIFCAPSRYESFGLVLVEAMSFGKPVVGADVGGMSEVVRDGVDGFLARPGDPDSLAACLLKLVTDPAMRETMGRNARSRYLQEFSAPVVARRTASRYRELAAGMQAARPSVDLEAALADVLQEVGLASGHRAQSLAGQLVDPGLHPIDPLALASDLWDADDGTFVDGLAARLAAQSDSAARGAWLAELNRHGSRRRILQDIAAAQEGPLTSRPGWAARISELPDDRPSRRRARIVGRQIRTEARRATDSAIYRSRTVVAGLSVRLARLRHGRHAGR